MTPTEFRECLAVLHWSQRGFADALGWSEGTVRGWARGTYPIPPEIAGWLQRARKWIEAHPLPRKG
jgi:DNA-binding transcriptional regulator YiaG